jgi:hypothetical protein
MSVMSGTFPDTYGVFYMTVNGWRVRGPSRHRHGERHRRNALPKWLSSYYDGDDAHDDDLQVLSRRWWLYLPSGMDQLNTYDFMVPMHRTRTLVGSQRGASTIPSWTG